VTILQAFSPKVGPSRNYGLEIHTDAPQMTLVLDVLEVLPPRLSQTLSRACIFLRSLGMNTLQLRSTVPVMGVSRIVRTSHKPLQLPLLVGSAPGQSRFSPPRGSCSLPPFVVFSPLYLDHSLKFFAGAPRQDCLVHFFLRLDTQAFPTPIPRSRLRIWPSQEPS